MTIGQSHEHARTGECRVSRVQLIGNDRNTYERDAHGTLPFGTFRGPRHRGGLLPRHRRLIRPEPGRRRHRRLLLPPARQRRLRRPPLRPGRGVQPGHRPPRRPDDAHGPRHPVPLLLRPRPPEAGGHPRRSERQTRRLHARRGRDPHHPARRAPQGQDLHRHRHLRRCPRSPQRPHRLRLRLRVDEDHRRRLRRLRAQRRLHLVPIQRPPLRQGHLRHPDQGTQGSDRRLQRPHWSRRTTRASRPSRTGARAGRWRPISRPRPSGSST